MSYYGVRNGRTVGVFDSWHDCQESVHGYSNNCYKKFSSYEDAFDFVNSLQDDSSVDGGTGEVYVDGCCLGNGTNNARAGIGVYWGPNDPYNVSERLHGGRQTNQRAEIEAARRAIVQAKAQCLDTLILYTDSMFFKQCMEEYIHKWIQNGWKTVMGNPVVHRYEFQQLLQDMNNIDVDIIHIPAHKGITGNEEADRLARLGAYKP